VILRAGCRVGLPSLFAVLLAAAACAEDESAGIGTAPPERPAIVIQKFTTQ
jgi:hypothetical protein